MTRLRHLRAGRGLALALAFAGAALPLPAAAQVALAPLSASGRSVTPVFEGWYLNRDGTYSISFGYFNRNTSEVLEISIGPDNFVEPGAPNQGQPTRFEPRRHWGVFAVKVPADYAQKGERGYKKLVWTLKIRGETFAIPGSLHPDWQIDALEGEAGSDNTPPALKFAEGGPEERGPLGITVGPLVARVGTPLTLNVWAADDGKTASSASGAARSGIPVALAWFKHQGPGDVVFGQPTARLTPTGGKATTTATFNRPGEYILRVRANDSAVAGAGHAQCCWTNGFVKVTVTQ